MPKLHSITIKNFKSNTGFMFDKVYLSYQLYGQEIGDSPIILVNHSLTGNSSLTGDKGWWSEIVGADKAIDLKFFIVWILVCQASRASAAARRRKVAKRRSHADAVLIHL